MHLKLWPFGLNKRKPAPALVIPFHPRRRWTDRYGSFTGSGLDRRVRDAGQEGGVRDERK